MKISLVISLFCSFAMTANTFSQNESLSMKIEKTSVKDVFKMIEDQSSYRFFYNDELSDINRLVDLTVQDSRIEDLLDHLFANSGISYTILENNLVVIAPKRSLQQHKVSGIVTDAVSGEPLPGVYVVVDATNTGVITDVNGNYSLEILDQSTVLAFSFVGYNTERIEVGDKSVIDVALVADIQTLEEVVVIGYGTQKKSDITGSVSSVNEDNIKNEPIQRMEQMLQGRVSGVAITTTSGAPDGSILIRVRGANSINAGNDPLYVVDGVANSDLFKVLDVSDIQSMEVLKDASSTAIYGSRGANGVIIVTTKKGIQEKPQIQFETQQSIGIIAKKYDMLNAAEFANFYNDYRKRNGATDDFYSAEQINEWEKNSGYDWQDLMYQTAHTQNYKASVSGGTSKVRYHISGNVRDAEGILIKSKYKKYGFRANVDVKTFDWLNINVDVNGSHDESKMNEDGITGVGGVVWDALTYSPTVGLKDEDGNWITDNVSSYQKNPYGKRMQNRDDIISNYFGGITKLTLKLPVKGLTMDLLGSVNYKNGMNYSLTSAENGLNDQSAATNTQKEYLNWQNTNQLTYTNDWGDHSLTATVVAEYTQEMSNNLGVEVTDLLTESTGYWNLGLGSIDTYSNGYLKSTLASYLGRVMYQLKDKYLLTATIRRDGSSKFQGDNKWGYFPSVALAWRVTEEEFLKSISSVSNLKLRTSWGVTGNQGIDAYSTLGMLSESNYSWGSTTAYPGYWSSDTPTPDLTWEKTYQWDLGIDVGFLKNRINATFDLYFKTTEDLLLEKAIPYYDGGGSVYANLGTIKNKGIEVDLNIIPITNANFNWESTFTIAYSKNEVVDMGGDQRLFPGSFNNLITFNPHVLEVGQPLGSLWGYTWLGLWRTDEAAEAAKYGQNPGDNKILDRDNNYVIDSEDQGIIGKAFPDYNFGWNNTLTWKKFEFNIFMQGAIGADRLNLTRYGISESISDARFITSKEGYYDMWTEDNQDTNIPNAYSSTINTNGGSTQYLESADFLRLKNLSVGYNLPLKGNNIKISLSAQNLFTITSYSGYDPELASSGSTSDTRTGGTSDTRAGLEQGAYPLPRTYTLSIRANF